MITRIRWSDIGRIRRVLALPARLSVGTYTFTATFTPTDPNVVIGSTSPVAGVAVTVVAPPAAAKSTLKLTASGAKQNSGTSSVTLTATVATIGSRAGNIQFTDGDQLLSTVSETSGTATFKVPAGTTIGAHSFGATFVPTDPSVVLGSNSAPVKITVIAAAPVHSTLKLTASGTKQINGTSSVKLTATVTTSKSAAGTITFLRGTRVFASVVETNGTATFMVPAAIGVGLNLFTATFVPKNAGVVLGSSAPGIAIVVVPKPAALKASVTLGTTTRTQRFGTASVTLTATVEVSDKGPISGTVLFKHGTAPFAAAVTVVKGKATFKLSKAMPVGEYVVYAVFTSTRSGLPGATSQAVTITVTK